MNYLFLADIYRKEENRMINNYLLAEEKGRNITLQIFSGKTELTEMTITDRIDFTGSTFNDFAMESKFRNVASDAYGSDMLEVEKFEALKYYQKHHNMTMVYVMIFNDGISRCYNLSELQLSDVKIEWFWCDRSTTEPEKGKEQKMCILLPNDKAKTYKYDKSKI